MARAVAISTPTHLTLWAQTLALCLPTGFALWLYGYTAAPGLTWANYGADGGDLLAAAATNGVPHPAGYPLYTLLLQGWLRVAHLLGSDASPAYWGNRLSSLCAALSVALTVATAAAILQAQDNGSDNGSSRAATWRWAWAALAGMAWAVTPLLWSQAVITEVYALHALLVAAIGWQVFGRQVWARQGLPLWLALWLGLGLAHHLTSVLLWPAVIYACWVRGEALHRRRDLLVILGGALGIGVLLHLRTLLVASIAPPAPVNWGYAHDLAGWWWTVSGAPYRDYLFGVAWPQVFGRVAALGRILVEQYTPVGLALALGGLAVWERQIPWLRNAALLWIVPPSIYAIGYSTVDSQVYLLPVVWVLALWLAQGLSSSVAWWAARQPQMAPTWMGVVKGAVVGVLLIGLGLLTGLRLPQQDLRQENAAQRYLAEVAATLEPGSMVISSADAQTFALWYGAWASDELAQGEAGSDLILVNYALYQYAWYRALLRDLYPHVPGLGEPFVQMVVANQTQRPIYLTEALTEIMPDLATFETVPVGPLWRLQAP